MVIIVWRSVKRTTDIKQGNRDDSGGGHAGTLVIVSAVVALAFCTVVASVVLAGAEVAWLEIFIVARTLAREGENLLTKATDVRSPACILMKQQVRPCKALAAREVQDALRWRLHSARSRPPVRRVDHSQCSQNNDPDSHRRLQVGFSY